MTTSKGYLFEDNLANVVVNVSNGGQIIFAGDTAAMDGTISGGTEIWISQNSDGRDATLYTGTPTSTWCTDNKILYVKVISQ